MVARIEASHGNDIWHFSKNVFPGEPVKLVSLLPDGGKQVFAINCSDDDNYTRIFDVEEGVIGKDGETIDHYVELATLRLGDPYFLGRVYSKPLEREIDFRISHQIKL